MNKNWIIGGSILGVILLIVGLCFASYISANNYGAAMEAQLEAAKDDNKNILAQYEQKIMEAVQVPTMYKDDFSQVLKESLQARYGAGGSKATMQWIKEHNIPFDSSLYTKIQQMIESGRKDFEHGQRKMIDVRRQYESSVKSFWRGFWLKQAGYPTIDFDDYRPVITGRVEGTYATGKEEAPLKLR